MVLRHRRALVASVLAFSSACSAFAVDANPASAPDGARAEPPAAAKQAVARSIDAGRKQYQAYEAALRVQTDKLLKELDGQLTAATKRGDLDGAVAIKALMERVASGLLDQECAVEVDALGDVAPHRRLRNEALELTLTADDRCDLYLNGKPVAEANYLHTTVQKLRVSSGDVFTCRASNAGGGDCGVILMLRDAGKKVVLATSTAWKSYKPADEQRWWELDREVFAASPAATALPDGWMAHRLKEEGSELTASAIWSAPQSITAYLAAVVP